MAARPRASAKRPFERAALADLEIEDEDSFRHVGLYADLKRVVQDLGPTFIVPVRGAHLGWERALTANLVFWEPGTSDVLSTRSIAADVVMHVAWHELARRALAPSVEASLLAESIASAFDVYLIGRLLGHSPDSTFVESQVVRMSEIAMDAGLDEDAFQSMLGAFAEAPERSFEALRQLLFDASLSLVDVAGPERGLETLCTFDGHRFAPILHHFEIATWVLRSRIERASPPSPAAGAGSTDASTFDRMLRESDDSIALLERSWVGA